MSMVFMYLMKDWYQTLDESSRGGSLANSRLTLGSRDTVLASKSTLNLVDASIQVDLTLDIIAYDSDDEVMGRKKLRSNKKGTPLYSKEDIREQYCITSKEVSAIESSHSRRFFGCIPNQDWKSCNRGLLLPSCVKKSKITSNENLSIDEGSPTVQQVKMGYPSASVHGAGASGENIVRDEDYGELQRKPRALCGVEKRYTYPESDLNLSRPLRTRPKSDVLPLSQSGETTLPTEMGTPSFHQMVRPSQLQLKSHESPSIGSDVVSIESHEMVRRTPVSVAQVSDFNTVLLRRQQPKTPEMFYEERRQKHVSFDSASLARSQSVAGGSFDDGHVASMSLLPSGRRTTSPEKHKSQERLLDIGVRRGYDLMDRRIGSIRSLDVVTSVTPIPNQSMVVAKVQKPMKTQATQTEITFAGKVLLPAYLTLSPRAAGYTLDVAEIDLESPKKPKKMIKIPSESECEILKEADLRLRLCSLEGTAIVDHNRILDGIRRRVIDEREILVNFQPSKNSDGSVKSSHKLLAKMPSEGNVISKSEAKAKRLLKKDRISETESSSDKFLGKSDSEPVLLFHERMAREVAQELKPMFRAQHEMSAMTQTTVSGTKELITRSDSDESNQSIRKRLLGLRDNSSGTPSGDSHKSESGSQYYSLTDYSSLPVSPEQATQLGKESTPQGEADDTRGQTCEHPSKKLTMFRQSQPSKEGTTTQTAEDEFGEAEKWSGSEKSMASSLEVDRTVAYSSDTEFGSVKSEDSHTLVDAMLQDSDGRATPSPLHHPKQTEQPIKMKSKDTPISPESESSSSHFTEMESPPSRSDMSDKIAERLSVVKGDLSRTDSNKSDTTSEDYVTANEYSDAGDSIRKGHRRSVTSLPPPELSDERPLTLDVTHLSLPRRKDRSLVIGGEISEGSLLFPMKEISVIPEVLRESVSSVATSPSIESSTSGSYTVDSGMSEVDFNRRASVGSVFENNNHQAVLSKQEPVEVSEEVKRQDTASSDAASEEDSSVKSRVAKFESLQQRDLKKQMEKHRVTLEIKLETDPAVPKSTENMKSGRRHHKEHDEPLSESSIFQKKRATSAHRGSEKPEIPPKPFIKDIKYTRRSLSPDADFCLEDRRKESGPDKHQKSPIDGDQAEGETKTKSAPRKDPRKDRRSENKFEEQQQKKVEERSTEISSGTSWSVPSLRSESQQKESQSSFEVAPKTTSSVIKKPRAPDPEEVQLEKTRSAELAIEEGLRRTTERRAYSESPESQWRARAERSHSFSREVYHESRSSISPERNSDGRPRKHDRKALEFRRTISDTTELLRLEARRRLLTRTPEREIDFSEMAKVLCTHCGERLRQSLEAEHNEALAERYLSADIRRSQDRDLSPRTSVSSGGLSLRDLTSSRRSSREHDLSPSAAELAELAAHARYLTSSGPSSLESLLRRSPRDTPVFLDSPLPSGSQGSLLRLSVQDIALEEDDEDSGVYAESYHSSVWIYIGDNEELTVWSPQLTTPESDKTVTVQRKSGEFGFRIHGSRPVVVSAIEPGTPAETSGLEVGDIIISVNNASVVDASHSEVVKIAHAGTDTLQLEVARTCHVLAPIITDPERQKPAYSGFLFRLGGIAPKKWYRRWFVLKQDNCLYYYKSKESRDPLGAIALVNHTVSRCGDAAKPFSFKITKFGSSTHFFAAENEESMNCWAALMDQAATCAAQNDFWMEMTTNNLSLAVSDIQNPNCQGYIVKLELRWKTWRRRYCVLKDGCLYIYVEASSSSALGVIHLHGYRVQTCLIAGRKYAFEAVPPDAKMRHFYFHADNETDKKRWLAALEYSIDRWIKVG